MSSTCSIGPLKQLCHEAFWACCIMRTWSQLTICLHILHSCIHARGIVAVLVQCFCCIKEGIKLLHDQTHSDWQKYLFKKFQLTNAVYCVFVCCYRSLSGYMVCGRLLRCWEIAIWIQLFGNIALHTCLVIFSCCYFKILQFGETAHE